MATVQLTAMIYANAHDNRGELYAMDWSSQWAPRLARHDEGDKDGPAISPGLNDGRRGRGHNLAMQCAVIDVETSKQTGEVPAPPQVLALYAKTLGITMALWTTHSHAERDPRYRVVVPFDAPIDLQAWPKGLDRMVTAVVAANLRLNGVIDQGKLGAESIGFLARHPPGAAHWSAVIEGTVQRAAEVTAVSFMALNKDMMRRAQIEELRRSREFPPAIRMAIDAYNDGHELRDMLHRYHYQRQGDRWKSPFQHGQAATCILPDGLRWVSFSESDIAEGVGQQSAAGDCCFGDAFSLFCYYEHGNNFRRALRAIGGDDGDKV